jgi:hypothetical protein
MARLPSRARTLTRAKGEENGELEQGIRGRNIRVLHRDRQTAPFTVVEGPGGMMMKPSASTATSEQNTRPSSLKEKGTGERSVSPGDSSSTIADLLPSTEPTERYIAISYRRKGNAEVDLQEPREPTRHLQQ